MKKLLICVILTFILTIPLTSMAANSNYVYDISNLNISGQTVSVNITKLQNMNRATAVYFAMYDADNTFLGATRVPVSLATNQTTTVRGTLNANKAYYIKAFVWVGVCTAQSDVLSITTRTYNEIEYGGEI